MTKLNVLFGDNRNDIKYKKDENLCHQRRSSIIFWSQFFTPFNSFIIKKRSAIIAVFSPSFFRGLWRHWLWRHHDLRCHVYILQFRKMFTIHSKNKNSRFFAKFRNSLKECAQLHNHAHIQYFIMMYLTMRKCIDF